MSRTITVYLIHLDTPISHARHYLGSAQDLEARLAEHQSGHGARLLEVALERGISWRLVRTWIGTRLTERELKHYKNSPALCPICDAEALTRKVHPVGG